MFLFADPHFVPQISVNGFTSNTVTLGWNVYSNISEYFNYYNVSYRRIQSGIPQYYTAYEHPLMVEKLKPGATYVFKVQKRSQH